MLSWSDDLAGRGSIRVRDEGGDRRGVRLHWVGSGSGPLVLLLHGFPEFWYSWRHQVPALAESFRVVAPDLRGYNLSAKPGTSYSIDTLTDDVFALIRSFGQEPSAVVGHDWGGGIAWVRRPRQLLRSWYMLFFQFPFLPELLLGANRCWPLVTLMRRSAVAKSAFSDEDLERYREAM